MQIVFYTQRVENIVSYGERRDCADQNIPRFIRACGYLPIPIPNIWDIAKELLEEVKPVGIVLTGGNSLVKYGGDAPERDELENNLIQYSIDRDIPVYGFCRGMQSILNFFECDLETVSGHVTKGHEVKGMLGTLLVNSYHNQGCYHVKESIEILGKTDDGVIEAIRVKGRNIVGTMWHPEREMPYRIEDIERVQKIFRKEDVCR